MKIRDRIYGEFEINDPVILELIKSKPVQRLKKLNQYGIPQEYDIFPEFTRYEHSVGVMLLLRKMGASLEEQVAGLLHDVSHTAFSHIIDFITGNTLQENYQDKNHSRIINNSKIPEILKKYKINVQRVVKLENYSLLEKELPDLCTDRIDYALREFYLWKNPKIVNFCLVNLTVYNNEIIFKSKIAAKKFAANFLELQKNHWGSTDTVIRYNYLSYILKTALKENIISFDDLYTDDNFVIKKLVNSKNLKINKFLTILSNKTKFKSLKKGINLKKKFRYVDPKFIYNGEVLRLSSEDFSFNQLLKSHIIINKKGINIPLL